MDGGPAQQVSTVTFLASLSVELSATFAVERAVHVVVDALAQVQTANSATVIHFCTQHTHRQPAACRRQTQGRRQAGA